LGKERTINCLCSKFNAAIFGLSKSAVNDTVTQCHLGVVEKIKTMRKLMTLISLLIFTVVTGQTKYDPQILILSPNQTTCDKLLEKEVSESNKKIKQNQSVSDKSKILDSPEFKHQPENIQHMITCEIEFSKNLDFYKNASLISEQFLAYRFFEKFPNLFIKLLDKKNDGTLLNLKTLSENEKLQYIINFQSIELYKEKKKSHARIKIQLYDNQTNSILVDKTFSGGWNNPGFEFSCTEKTIECALNNSLSQALNEIIYKIASNSPSLIREKELAQQRSDLLGTRYYDVAFDKQLIKEIIPSSDSTINIDMAYQALFSDDKTKFVAFFIQQVPSQSLKSLTDSNRDKNVLIISGKEIKDKGFLDTIPQIYCYIVCGVKYNNEWYYKKSEATYFEGRNLNDGKLQYFENLQNWNFFKENTTDFNPEFWETLLFKKVPDLKKDPQWEQYGESIWKTEEINNRDYIGIYEIVADAIRDRIKVENTKFATKTSKLFSSLYHRLKPSLPSTYEKISEHALIFPTDKSVVMNPTLITHPNGTKTIHYFVLLVDENKLYEWAYFSPKEIKDDLFGEEVVKQIGSLTNWNFSVDNLNDKKFWSEYVLLQANNSYKYLKEIK
jgi:hypothetical protein